MRRRGSLAGRRCWEAAWALGLAGLSALPAIAADGRLLATGGATQAEGAAGGGIVPWAVIAGYGTREQHGGTAFRTHLDTGDYTLDSVGAAYGFGNRLELSLARQRFGLGTLQRQLALPVDRFRQDVVGAKLRLAGDLVYGAMPQVSLGVQHKRHRDFDVPRAVGAREDRGTDIYIAASKLFLGGAAGYNLLLNATLRSTSANQAGLLGFGGDLRGGRSLVWEGSAAVMPARIGHSGSNTGRSPTTSALPARTTGATCSRRGSPTSVSQWWPHGPTWGRWRRWTGSAAPICRCS